MLAGSAASYGLIAVFVALSLAVAARRFAGSWVPLGSYVNYTWVFFLSLTAAEFVSFTAGIWIMALLCFWALREYFSLIHIRLQDRLGILVAYLSIPFMIYFIQIDWYGMFIISLPVYAFLAVPLFVSLGGKDTEGIVFSIGAIDLGLFLFVYCMGHIGYLMLFSTWKAGMMILSVAVCDGAACWVNGKIKGAFSSMLARYLVPVPFTVFLSLVLSSWTEIPLHHALVLGLLIPFLSLIAHYTIDCIKVDLGVHGDTLAPGRGEVIDNMKSLFYVAPVVFHYIRYFLT